MQTIKETVQTEMTIKKSKFIAILFPIHTLDDVKEKITESKEKRKDATHYCYAYILDNKEKAVDDGEPAGTAGIPILSTLRKNDVNHVLCIVVRYFGGIKLGSGGLIRAYSKACRQTLQQSTIVDLEKGYEIKVEFDYDHSKQIDALLINSMILKKEFQEKVVYFVKIKTTELQLIRKQIEAMGEMTILKEGYI